MAQIYSLPSGQQVYDSNGQTYDVRTGQVVGAVSVPPTLPQVGSPIPGGGGLTYEPADVANLSAPVSVLSSSAVRNEAAANVAALNTEKQAATNAAASPPPAPPPSSPSLSDESLLKAAGLSSPTTETEKLYKDQLATYDTQIKTAQASLDTFKTTSDSLKQRQIDSIKALYDVRIAQQTEVNRRSLANLQMFNIREGTERYAGPISGGILSAEESAGLQRLTALKAEEQDLIIKAEASANELDFKLLKQSMDDLKDTRKEISNHLFELQKEGITQNYKVQTELLKVQRQSALAGVIRELKAQGTTDPNVIYATAVARGWQGTLDDVKDAVAVFLPEIAATGDIAEFNREVAAGLVPKSITDLPKEQQLNAWRTAKAKATQRPSFAIRNATGATYSGRLQQEVSNIYSGRYGTSGAREQAIAVLKGEFPTLDVAKDIYNRIPDDWEKNKRQTATTVEPQAMSDLLDDIQNGSSLVQLYQNYPGISPSLIQSIYYNQ